MYFKIVQSGHEKYSCNVLFFVYLFSSWFCFIEPIKIEVEPMHQRQKEGSSVEFKCKVQGNKKVFYEWVKDGTEMQGQNSSSLVLGCVEMRDFGCYTCRVCDPNADCIKSSTAVLDVAPRDGMGKCYLHSIILKKKHILPESVLPHVRK